jgi:hypothetical protein
LEAQAFLTDLDKKLAFDYVEPLVLVIMEVSGRAAFGVEGVLENEETAAVMWDNLESNRAHAKSPMLTESVLTSGDPKRGGGIGRRRHRLCHSRLLWSEEEPLAV